MLPVDPVGDTVLSTCPHVERLQELVSGRLDPAQEHELEQHLDGCEACRMGVASLVREGRSKAAGTWSLGRYQIGNVLGAGGMGVVYRGWDPALAREVAIKVVKSTDDASLSARLEREARAMARLNHPNVCQVYDVGTDAGELWIAMELIDGTTFRDLLDKARPDRQTVLALLAGIGRGLEAAHAIGMVHRDIKPANVLIDRTGRPVVTDFGLAQHTGGTRSYAMAGTPAYMAPEQLEGMPADARSDQYAFAVMAHEAVAGARPRPRNQASATLGARTRAVLNRALHDDPAARFPSIGELVVALAAASAADRPSRWRWLAVAAAVAVLGGVGGYVAVMRGDRGEPGAASAAPPRDAGAVAVVPSRPIVTPIAALPIDAGVAPAPPRPAITAPARPPRRIVRPPAAGSAAPPPAIAIVTNPAYTHIGAANVRKDAGDGRGCLAELDAAEREGTMDAASGVEVKFLRATCLMLAGQCEAGRKLSAEYWNGKNLGDSTAARDVDAMVAENCRGGARSDRDRLVRAVFVLGDLAHRHSAGECRAAYDDARALAKTAPPAENGDTLFDLAERIHNTAPGCFARAGDCVSAWTVAKEVDETFSNHVSTDVTKRGTFHWSVGVKCIDKDQGALSDAEVFERAHSELREIREVPTRTAAFCGARIATALAVLPRLPANTGYRLLDAAATCLGYTKDCTGAWQQYSQVGQAIGLDDRRVRSEFTQHFSRLMGCAPP